MLTKKVNKKSSKRKLIIHCHLFNAGDSNNDVKIQEETLAEEKIDPQK
jgi:hypothetical protein